MPVNKILAMYFPAAEQVLFIDITGSYLYSLTSKKGKISSKINLRKRTCMYTNRLTRKAREALDASHARAGASADGFD